MDHQNITYYSNGQEVGIASHDYNIISDADLGENLLIGQKTMVKEIYLMGTLNQ